ncbi:hypothetical protein [Pseudovibrio sp. JE062]|uniref:hypothetical protein n=1 Tax=Pseudovibrio sp. JE062 TaxID=439495 RepID=UPI000186C10F|nr:hypothetical protein [Pseudovibrio sp. JE062]EEA91835.1 hypothetical protein PJE062_2382 [Pseudovibrio sp. JE062]
MPLKSLSRLATLGLVITFSMLISSLAQADTSTDASTDPSLFKECPVSQDEPNAFALCATAKCWTVDTVAYCKCDALNEQSISLPFHYEENGEKKDVCDLLKAGIDNGFTVSTYATPRQMETDYDPKSENLGEPMAMYTCPNSEEAPAGYSAQCDGGFCFNSTQGKDFPGIGPVKDDEIICSCPAVPSPKAGFQIAGPWLCDPGDSNSDGTCCDSSFHDKLCSVKSVSSTGTELMVGAPLGVAKILSKKLDGKEPAINRCVFK